MNPDRKAMDVLEKGERPAERDDELAILWVWTILGALLVLTDAGQSRPWGAISSLGLLVLVVAIVGLGRHHIARWRRRSNSSKPSRRGEPEV